MIEATQYTLYPGYTNPKRTICQLVIENKRPHIFQVVINEQGIKVWENQRWVGTLEGEKFHLAPDMIWLLGEQKYRNTLHLACQEALARR